MNLILTEIQTLIATEDMKCEASEIFWTIRKSAPIDYSMATLGDAQLLFKGRFGKIKQGERYLYMTYATDDGELMEFTCLSCMSKLLFNLSLYPYEIQNALIEYRKNYRLKQSI